MKSKQDFATKEDWFDYLKYYYAGQAMQGILSNSSNWNTIDESIKWVSHACAKHADDLIAELNKQS